MSELVSVVLTTCPDYPAPRMDGGTIPVETVVGVNDKALPMPVGTVTGRHEIRLRPDAAQRIGELLVAQFADWQSGPLTSTLHCHEIVGAIVLNSANAGIPPFYYNPNPAETVNGVLDPGVIYWVIQRENYRNLVSHSLLGGLEDPTLTFSALHGGPWAVCPVDQIRELYGPTIVRAPAQFQPR